MQLGLNVDYRSTKKGEPCRESRGACWNVFAAIVDLCILTSSQVPISQVTGLIEHFVVILGIQCVRIRCYIKMSSDKTNMAPMKRNQMNLIPWQTKGHSVLPCWYIRFLDQRVKQGLK